MWLLMVLMIFCLNLKFCWSWVKNCLLDNESNVLVLFGLIVYIIENLFFLVVLLLILLLKGKNVNGLLGVKCL